MLEELGLCVRPSAVGLALGIPGTTVVSAGAALGLVVVGITFGRPLLAGGFVLVASELEYPVGGLLELAIGDTGVGSEGVRGKGEDDALGLALGPTCCPCTLESEDVGPKWGPSEPDVGAQVTGLVGTNGFLLC